jgi:hypothetical protein
MVGHVVERRVAARRAAYAGLPPETATGDPVAVAGRVVLLRNHVLFR